MAHVCQASLATCGCKFCVTRFGLIGCTDRLCKAFDFNILTVGGFYGANLWLKTNSKLSHPTPQSENDTLMLTGGKLYKEIFDNSSDATFVVDVQFGWIFCFESLNSQKLAA